MQPNFMSIDLGFHAQNVVRYKKGEIIASAAPGVATAWYPMALYALLSPFCGSESQDNEGVVRAAFLAFECLAAFFIYLVSRACGAPQIAAVCAVTGYLAQPEGLLVAIKGSAANELGSLMTIAMLWALAARKPTVVFTVFASLLLLSHAGAAIAGLLVLGLWSVAQKVKGEIDARQLGLRCLGLLAALGIAWLTYYRHVPLQLSAHQAWAVHWYRIGKVLQDLVLKFGAAPLALAVLGFRKALPPARGLLASWLAAVMLLWGAAVTTSFPLRFELLALPAVAMLSGWGAAELLAQRKARLVQGAWLVAVIIQVAIGAANLFKRFYAISVILESPHWPFPFH
jgi:hypothetical protein